jgi:serine/threonine protein kinase
MNERGNHDREISSAIMEVALSLDDPSAREDFLERVFENQEAAKEEMAQLLEASDGAANFFLEAREQRAKVTATILSEKKPGSFPAHVVGDDFTTEVLGPYYLAKRLGEGGGGVVYEAEQELPIRRRVAVKIFRMSVENRDAVDRFNVERQALALMDHPNIAKVFDAGTTSSGKPYFAMELVTGESIIRYSNHYKLGCVERLELFALVCNAIQHAHQKGIIHRDIKPSNIIVTRQDGANVPKIIDFGIAKSSKAPSGESITAHDQVMGTPNYMSPEQMALTGIDVDTRSDIFSLGVVLYELLTGTTLTERPTEDDPTFSKIRKSLLKWESLRPSELLANLPSDQLRALAKERSTDPATLLDFVKGDLDWIVMMALEKDRMRRYQTANGLAFDIKRLLTHQPIAARPPSRLYVLTKLIRRNRLACGVAVLLAMFLITGLAVTVVMYERERKNSIEQLRLKNEAQAARNEESRLREQADARSNVTRAAFLLDQGRIKEADELRKDYPLSSIEPSLEAAAVFRTLGDWNAEHGRWDEAIQCFQLLRQAIRYGSPQKILNGNDLMAIAAVLHIRDEKEYLEFREEVLTRYAPAVGVLNAEHLLKICLIHSPEPGMLEALERDVETMGAPHQAPVPAWAAFSLSLYHLRTGNYELALEWSQTGLTFPDRKNSCEVSLEAVAAIANFELGKEQLAADALSRAHHLTELSDGREFQNGVSIPPVWFDWAIAEILIQEAEVKIQAIPQLSGKES